MILFMFILLMTTMMITMYLAVNPINLGLNILMIAFLLAASFSTLMSSWYAFLLFLIYIGGMLVLFAYFLAIQPNQQLTNILNVPIITLSFFMLYFISATTDMKTLMIAFYESSINFLYTLHSAPMILLFALTLLLAMIVVVKLTHRAKGPLRPFMYV